MRQEAPLWFKHFIQHRAGLSTCTSGGKTNPSNSAPSSAHASRVWEGFPAHVSGRISLPLPPQVALRLPHPTPRALPNPCLRAYSFLSPSPSSLAAYRSAGLRCWAAGSLASPPPCSPQRLRAPQTRKQAGGWAPAWAWGVLPIHSRRVWPIQARVPSFKSDPKGVPHHRIDVVLAQHGMGAGQGRAVRGSKGTQSKGEEVAHETFCPARVGVLAARSKSKPLYIRLAHPAADAWNLRPNPRD